MSRFLPLFISFFLVSCIFHEPLTPAELDDHTALLQRQGMSFHEVLDEDLSTGPNQSQTKAKQLLSVGNSAQARWVYETNYKRDAKDLRSGIGVGLTYLAEGRFQKALAQFDKVSKKNVSASIPHAYLAWLFAALKQPDKSKKELHLFSKLSGPYSVTLYISGWAAIQANESEKAERFLLSAIEQEPRLLEPYFDLARLYQRQKRYGEAEESLKALLVLKPEFEQAKRELGQVQRMKGRQKP